MTEPKRAKADLSALKVNSTKLTGDASKGKFVLLCHSKRVVDVVKMAVLFAVSLQLSSLFNRD